MPCSNGGRAAPTRGRPPLFFFFFQAEDGIRDADVTEFRRVLFRSFTGRRCRSPGFAGHRAPAAPPARRWCPRRTPGRSVPSPAATPAAFGGDQGGARL